MVIADDQAAGPEAAREIAELRRALIREQKAVAKARARTEDLIEAVYAAASSAALAVGRPTIPTPTRDRRVSAGDTAVLHLTDWQGGKRTPSYGLDVMDERVDRFMVEALAVVEARRTHIPVRSAALLFGGDLLEGVSIFPGQEWQVEASLYTQMFRVAARAEAAVRFALEHFETVSVVWEPGNHGRIGSKNDGLPKGDNYDRFIGEIVRQALVREPAIADRLTWEARDHWFQQVVVGNYRAMLLHGDEVRGFGGNTPSYALVRKGNAWASGAARWEFRDIYVGHYHQTMQLTLANGGQLYMTGSTESDNAYAAEFVAATSVPSQRLHFVDPDAGRVRSIHIIELD